MAYLLERTPAQDTPVFTYATTAPNAAPTIAGSAGWWREKRQGTAETAPGGAQTATAPLHLSGSTYFRYIGVPAAVGLSGRESDYVHTDFKPGSTASLQGARWLFGVEFTTESPVVELRLYAGTTNPQLGLVLVNGRRVQERSVQATASAGAGYSAILTFPDARPRTITLLGLNNVDGSWGGVAVQAGYTVAAPSGAVTKRVAIIGDSYTNGAGPVLQTETFAWRLAMLMGADQIIQAGIGGTGWTAELSGQPSSRFAGRIAPVMAMQPHVVILAGGRNDSASGLQAAIESSLDQIGGSVERYLLSSASQAGQSAVNDAISAAGAARSVRFLHVPIDTIEKLPDGVHPSYAGHQALASQAYALLANTGKALPDIDALRLGSQTVSGLYLGQTRIWPS